MMRESDVPRRRVPRPLTSLIGREHEIDSISATLSVGSNRLVTLTGPGGVGKTRLALAVAEQLDETFEGDVWFISLVPLTDHDEVLPAIARTLKIEESSSQPVLERLIDDLLDRRVLLVLDNVEHVLGATPKIAQLLSNCPGMYMLATGRGPLRLRGEHQYPVPPLKLPASDARQAQAAVLASDAVQLFIERARAVDPTFEVTEASAAVIGDICRRLDGLPLALELAAGWVRVLPLEDLLERLDKPLAMLTGGLRDAPDRQQTMHDTIQWSYALLTDREQLLFRQLSVFNGGWTLEAAEAVCSGGAVLEDLSSLVEKSLVRRIDQPESGTRYDMLMPVREFAVERLEEHEDEADHVRDSHARYFLSVVEGFYKGVDGPERMELLALLETEHDNLRAGLRWLRETEQTELGFRLITELGKFWVEHGYIDEGLFHTEVFLHMVGGSQRTMHRAWALNRASWLRLYRGEFDIALSLVDEACSIAAEHHDRSNLPFHLFARGHSRRHGGDLQGAEIDWETALSMFREQDNAPMIGRLLVGLGNLARCQGELDRARTRLEEALALAQARDIQFFFATATGVLGLVEEESGDVQLAFDCFRKWLTFCYELDITHGMSEPIERIARITRRHGEVNRAVCLFSAATVLRDRGSKAWFDLDDRLDPQNEVAALRSAMSPADFEAAWDQGRTISVEDAIELALQPLKIGEEDVLSAPDHHLTPRELDVLRLVAEGLTDPQIAEKLFISPRTVSSHLTSVYTKLGVSSRTAATRLAIEHHLI